MFCKHFNECGSCTLPLAYEKQLNEKISNALDILKIDLVPEIVKSKTIHYRNRAEFRIFHEGEIIHYALYSKNKKLFFVESCCKTDEKIYELMPKLLNEISKNSILKTKLFSVEFLSSFHEVLVSLIYHKKIDETWLKEAKKLSLKLGVKIIGRSKKVKLCLNDDFIKESLMLNQKKYFYHLHEGSFSQPNRFINQFMIKWVIENLKKDCKDLLELYCGHGNFTIPLSKHFKKVLATEISKTSIKSAIENCILNDVENITFLRMGVEELLEALKGERDFFRLRNINLESFDFSHVFVDPPRAGLDEKSLNFIKNFDEIIYISCNVKSLNRDLKELKKTHFVRKLAFFDQFPYTYHLESGVILRKN